MGATGSTGFEILKRLAVDNHTVQVLVRDPSRLKLDDVATKPGQVTIIKGEVGEGEKLAKHFKDCDAIISALGTGLNNVNTNIYSVGGRNILKAMHANNVRRLITMTSASIDLTDPETDTFLMNRIIRPNYNKVYYDQTRWETILDEASDIDWICVRPPKLVEKPFSGKYRVNINHAPKGGWKISRADLAHFVVKQLTSDEYIRQKLVVAY